MKLKSVLSGALAGGAIVSIGIAVGGCGGGGGGEDYGEVLHGLHSAAQSKAAYGAVDQAEDLEATQKATIDAFCFVTQQMLDNLETAKLSSPRYFSNRIALKAEAGLSFVSTNPVRKAVHEMDTVFDLESFNTDLARRYASACIH